MVQWLKRSIEPWVDSQHHTMAQNYNQSQRISSPPWHQVCMWCTDILEGKTPKYRNAECCLPLHSSKNPLLPHLQTKVKTKQTDKKQKTSSLPCSTSSSYWRKHLEKNRMKLSAFFSLSVKTHISSLLLQLGHRNHQFLGHISSDL